MIITFYTNNLFDKQRFCSYELVEASKRACAFSLGSRFAGMLFSAINGKDKGSLLQAD